MKKIIFILGFGMGLFFLTNCSGSKKLNSTGQEEVITIQEDLDTVVVTPDINMENEEPRERQYTFHRKADLVHTRLKLSFDWEKKHVLGEAELIVTALAKPLDTLEFHAQGFDISGVFYNHTPVKFSYDQKNISIPLELALAPTDTAAVKIIYVAKPDEIPESGSAAIHSDKGLFFINAQGNNKKKPRQIWTQGETENNSRWMPTIDKPNERCTQEIYLTVDNNFVTLSNGLLIKQTDNQNGTRTDYWRMDLPHPPYLFMLAVGEFAVVKDHWNAIPVEYYVDPEYAIDAKTIFNHTPEMIQFFSSYTGIPYPWPKYAQIVVRDFVSGAMENTTASVFGDFIQKKSRELIDAPNDYIVAHELIHHWFGNLVTCESWANLTLNEGFANYGEYLWNEFKYGKDEADYSRQNELAGYFNQVSQGDAHPLIDPYLDKEAMFDAHSYNKGGLVIHMLRDYLGADLFKKGINLYLRQHAFASVEADDLRLALEKVSGEDLSWFFDQWFFESGHPVLDVTKKVSNKGVFVTISQKQDLKKSTLFATPLEIAFYDDLGHSEIKTVWLKKEVETFSFVLDYLPALVLVDPRDILLKQINHDQTIAEYQKQYLFNPALVYRTEALMRLEDDDSPATQEVLVKALDDNHWSLRELAIQQLKVREDESLIAKLVNLAQQDAHSAVRSAAIKKLSRSGHKKYLNTLKAALQQDNSYQVMSAALQGIYEIDQIEGLNTLVGYENVPALQQTVLGIYAQEKNPKYFQYFKTVLSNADGFDYLSVLGAFTEYCLAHPPTVILDQQVLAFFTSLALDQEKNLYTRYGSAKFVSELKDFSEEKQQESGLTPEAVALWNKLYQEAKKAFSEIKNKETSPQLRNAYMFMN